MFRFSMADIVVCTLGKRRVNIAEREHSFFGQPGREGNGVPFGYAYVEHSFGHGFLHYAHRAACRHGGCYSHNPVVPACQFEQCLAEYVLVSRSFVAHVFLYELAGFLVELAGSVPC